MSALSASWLSRIGRLFVALMLALAAGAATAHAEVRAGEGTDASLDQLTAGRDLTALRASYDTAGVIEATVTLRGEPSAANNAVISVHVGTPTPAGSCGSPYAAVLAYLDPADTQVLWGLSSDATLRTTATKGTSGSTVTLRATGAELAGAGYSCATAAVDQTGTGTTRYDELAPPLSLVVPAPTPVPTPAPTAPPVTPSTPTPTPASTAPTTSPKPEAKVRVVVVNEPDPVALNEWRKVKVGVVNGTKRKTGPLQLSVSVPRGVQAPTRLVRLAPIKSGRAKTVVVRVRAGKRAGSASKIGFTLRGGRKVVASTSTQLRLSRPATGVAPPTPQPSTPGTTGTPASPNDLTGRFYTRFDHELKFTPGGFDYVAVSGGYAFVGAAFVYDGLPAGGWPTCTERTVKCLPYAYDAAANVLTIDGKPVQLSTDRGTLISSGKSFFANTIPAPGTRFTLTLKNISSTLFPYDAVKSSYLRMSADGHFDFGVVTAITPGDGYQTVGITGPADQRGTYEVLDRARIRLSFESGRVVEHTISVFGADPAKDGILLDSSKYWVP